jgi:serine/threonine-protein kinase
LAYGYLGDIDGIFDPVRAAEPLRHALELSVEWSSSDPNPEPKIFAALFTREKADILWGTGDLTGARDTFSQALSMFKDAMAQDPANADWDRERLSIMERLGLVSGDPDYFNLGDRSAAVEWLQRDVSEDEQRVAADSRDQRARFDLSQSLAELAGAYRDADPLTAEKLYERSLSLGNSALQTDPEDADILTWQSFARIWFSANLQHLGKNERALSELTSAVTVAQRLVDRDHTSIPAREVLGVALYTRARQLLFLGDAAGAEIDLQQSEQVLSDLHKEFPNTLLFFRDLADCYQATGDLAAHRSDWGEAQLEYQKSLRLWEHWTDIGKSTAYDQQRRQQASTLERNATKHLPKHSS